MHRHRDIDIQNHGNTETTPINTDLRKHRGKETQRRSDTETQKTWINRHTQNRNNTETQAQTRRDRETRRNINKTRKHRYAKTKRLRGTMG